MASLMLPWEVHVPVSDPRYSDAHKIRMSVKLCFNQHGVCLELYRLMVEYAQHMLAYLRVRRRSAARPMILFVWRIAPRSGTSDDRAPSGPSRVGQDMHLSNTTIPLVELFYALYACVNLAIFLGFELQLTERDTATTDITDDGSSAGDRLEQRLHRLRLEAYGFTRLLRKLWSWIIFPYELHSITRNVPKSVLDSLHGYLLAKLTLSRAAATERPSDKLPLLCKALRTLMVASALADRRYVTAPYQHRVDIDGPQEPGGIEGLAEQNFSELVTSDQIGFDYTHFLNLERMRLLANIGLVISDMEDERAYEKFTLDIAKNYLLVRAPTYQIDRAANTVNASLWYYRAAAREIRQLNSTVYQRYMLWLQKRNEIECRAIHQRFAEAEACYRQRFQIESTFDNIVSGIVCILKVVNETSVLALLKDEELTNESTKQLCQWMSVPPMAK